MARVASTMPTISHVWTQMPIITAGGGGKDGENDKPLMNKAR